MATAEPGAGALGVIHDFHFAKAYHSGGGLWQLSPEQRLFELSVMAEDARFASAGIAGVDAITKVRGVKTWYYSRIPSGRLT